MSLAPLLAAPPVIQIHVAAALLALIGAVTVMLNAKGSLFHRRIGYVFAAGMLITAISSFWITRNGQFSWIHLLSVLTLVQLPRAVLARRRGRITAHGRAMTGLVLGLFIAGIFTFLPGRIMHDVVTGRDVAPLSRP